MQELSRPRPRTCASKKTVNKAKAIACHRAAVVFGVTYRREKDSDGHASTRMTTARGTSAFPSKRDQQCFAAAGSGHFESCDDGGSRVDMISRSLASTRRRNSSSRAKDKDGGGGGGTEGGRGGSGSGETKTADMIHSRKPLDRKTLAGNCVVKPVLDRYNAELVELNRGQTIRSEGGVVEGEYSRKGLSHGWNGTTQASGSEGGSEGDVDSQWQKYVLLEKWLREVSLETKTAGTALQVSTNVYGDDRILKQQGVLRVLLLQPKGH